MLEGLGNSAFLTLALGRDDLTPYLFTVSVASTLCDMLDLLRTQLEKRYTTSQTKEMIRRSGLC